MPRRPPFDAPSAVSEPLRRRLELGVRVARDAGDLLRAAFGRERTIDQKSSAIDLVTDADRASETCVLDHVRGAFPDDAVLAEESGGGFGDGGYTWVVDPLDGTTNFAHGIPHFSVSIAVVARTRPVIGVVHDPLRDETMFAVEGGGAWLQTRQQRASELRVSTATHLGSSVLGTGFPYDRATDPDNNLAEFVRIVPRVRGIRRCGSAALDLAWVACGRLDGFWELRLAPWDTAAGALLVREAGGRLCTRTGADWTLQSTSVVATGPALLPALLEALQR